MKVFILFFASMFSLSCADHIQSSGAVNGSSQKSCSEGLDKSYFGVEALFASSTYKCIVCHSRYKDRAKIEKDIERIIISVELEDTSNPRAMPRNRPRLNGEEINTLKNFAAGIRDCK